MSWLFSEALVKAYENSRCSQGQVEESSEATCSAGEPSAQLNVMPTPHKFWLRDKTMEFSDLSRFGLTLSHFPESRGEELLTWFLAGFRVRTLARQGRALASKGIGRARGSTWQELSVKYDLDTHLWRTHQGLFPEVLPWSSVTLPKWGMCLGGLISAQPPLEWIATVKGSGSLPTPSGVNGGRNHTMGRLDEWGGSGNPFRGTEIGRVRCASFEEWMMGWPTGWSALTPLGMDRFQEWQQQHSAFFPDQSEDAA